MSTGPGHESALSGADMSPIYTYTFQKGLILQAGLTGTQVSFNDAANKEFYGVEKTPVEILTEDGAVTAPENEKLASFYKYIEIASNKA